MQLADRDPMSNPGQDRIFYDGKCGLCHGVVRFVIERMPDNCTFRFAPLQGPTFKDVVAEGDRVDLPDSLIVQTCTGEVLVRSEATLYIIERLGWGWRVMAGLSRLVPSALRDATYDFVARNRVRFFRRPQTECPLLPEALMRCFDP